jgi:glycosyltransferase involved in cell wall biosynthesis
MKKVLQLSTYPIVNPLHGGQIRISEIRKYLEGKGCFVKSISISERTHQSYSADDFLVDQEKMDEITDVPFCSDFATSVLCESGEYFEFIKKEVKLYNPDILFVEQAWLWPAIKRLVEQRNIKSTATIVYSSHNVEYQTKKDILISHGLSVPKIDQVIEKIRALEQDICRHADYVVSVSKSDASEFAQLGARKILLCQNGVANRVEDAHSRDQLDAALNKRKYVLFVGSAYPPNAQGFWSLLGSSLAFLPPDNIIVIAGGVSKIIEEYMPDNGKLFANVNMNRLKLMGFVSENVLNSLVKSASVIILPIVTGGGSNLKTAEAIASSRPVVATSIACRGYDFINQLDNFEVADDPIVFRREIVKSLDVKIIDTFMSPEKVRLRESVYWDNVLLDLDQILE